jgi:catechol 2,3-dioxygenase-like lactoylglutathione lyase family enzyme
MNKIVPELLCADIAVTKRFYLQVLGFSVLFERAEETFACLGRAGVELMFEQVDGPGRRWITGPLEKPFGRGINFQIETDDVDALHAQVLAVAAERLYVPIEEKQYRCNDQIVSTHQFVVQDPDGYLLRFARDFNTQDVRTQEAVDAG